MLVRVFIAVKRCHDHDNSYKRKHLTEVAAYSSEVQFIIVMVGEHGSIKADMVLATS